MSFTPFRAVRTAASRTSERPNKSERNDGGQTALQARLGQTKTKDKMF